MIQVKIAIYQEGENCIVEKDNMKQTIPSCNAMKFARTMWDKPGDKYTKEEMETFGFGLKSEMYSNYG